MSENTSKTSDKDKEARKTLIQQSFDKCVKQNGKALEKLAKH